MAVLHYPIQSKVIELFTWKYLNYLALGTPTFLSKQLLGRLYRSIKSLFVCILAGHPWRKAHVPAPPLLPRRADCPVILPRKPSQLLPWQLSEQVSTGHTSAALTHQPPPRAPVTAAPSHHLEALTVSPLSSQRQESLQSWARWLHLAPWITFRWTQRELKQVFRG